MSDEKNILYDADKEEEFHDALFRICEKYYGDYCDYTYDTFYDKDKSEFIRITITVGDRVKEHNDALASEGFPEDNYLSDGVYSSHLGG